MKDYEQEKQAARIQLDPRPKTPGVVQIKERRFNPKTGEDIGLQVVEELTRAELDSRIAAAEAELAWLQSLSADFDAVVEAPNNEPIKDARK